MEVALSPERARFVRRLVADGRYVSPLAAVEAALRLLEAGDGSCLRQAVSLGLEQVLAGRSMATTADDVVRDAARKAVSP